MSKVKQRYDRPASDAITFGSQGLTFSRASLVLELKSKGVFDGNGEVTEKFKDKLDFSNHNEAFIEEDSLPVIMAKVIGVPIGRFTVEEERILITIGKGLFWSPRFMDEAKALSERIENDIESRND